MRMLGDRTAMAENRKCIRIRFSSTAECAKHHMDIEGRVSAEHTSVPHEKALSDQVLIALSPA
jgi:hypothetical protein